MGTRHTQGKPAVALVQEGLECVVAVLGRRHPLDQLVLFFLREIDQLVLGVVGQLEEELEVQVVALEGEVRGGSTRPDPTGRRAWTMDAGIIDRQLPFFWLLVWFAAHSKPIPTRALPGYE
jgi:hypothetical protein